MRIFPGSVNASFGRRAEPTRATLLHVGCFGIGLLGLSSFFGCTQPKEPPKFPQATAAVPTLTPTRAPAPAPRFATSWQNESEYVVNSIVSELTKYLLFSRATAEHSNLSAFPQSLAETTRIAPSDLNHPKFHVTIRLSGSDTWERDLNTDSGIFSAETYQDWTSALAVHLGIKLLPESSVNDRSDLETELLQNQPSVLLKLDKTVSTELQNHFNNPAFHEEAALLIAAFSWRDQSGPFFDLIPELARLTAHRVFAAALRGGKVREGNLATLDLALEDALLGLQAGALEQAGQLPDRDPYRSWAQTIRIRATGDFRVLTETVQPSFIERIEWFRALAREVNPEVAQKRYNIVSDQLVLSDWWRALNEPSHSVETGHVLLKTALAAELAEAELAYENTGHPKASSFAQLVAGLNQPLNDGFIFAADPAQSATVEIIGWSLWAQLLQRELCFAITRDFNFLENSWGVPDKARVFRSVIDEKLGALTLYPLVKRFDATAETYYRSAQDEAMRLAKTKPELIPNSAWYELYNAPGFCSYYIPQQRYTLSDWCVDNPLPGTAYDLESRVYQATFKNRPDFGALVSNLRMAAPYSTQVIHQTISDGDKHKPTPEAAVEAYGAVLEYRPGLCRYIADLYGALHNLPQKEVWLKRSAVLRPEGYRLLGDLYKEENRERDAADAYSQWIANEDDQVGIANDAEWLVEYFEHHGQPDQATALADRVAEVYSFLGLSTKAHLLEERHEYEQALFVYQEINERYESPGTVIGFLLRHQDGPGTEKFEPELLSHLIETYLPNGLAKFDPSHFTRPTGGVLVSSQTRETIQAQLQQGDVIVAVNGYAAFDWPHFKMIRDFDPRNSYEVVVWRKQKLMTLPPLPAHYRFGVDLPTYRPASS